VGNPGESEIALWKRSGIISNCERQNGGFAVTGREKKLRSARQEICFEVAAERKDSSAKRQRVKDGGDWV